MEDLLAGAESDSGLTLQLDCKTCGRSHRVVLSRIDGRFAYRCGRRMHAGTIKNWDAIRSKAAAMKKESEPCQNPSA